MKSHLISLLRKISRALPLPVKVKLWLANQLFSYAPGLFRHSYAYKRWLWAHPEFVMKELKKQDLQAERNRRIKEAQFQPTAPAILMMTHAQGGGTEHHVQQLAAKLQQEGVKVWILRDCFHQWVELTIPQQEDGNGLLYHFDSEYEALLTQLKKLDIRHIHVHHTIDFPSGFRKRIVEISEQLECAFDYTAHDYYSICPRFTLFDEGTRNYCGEPDIRHCQACVTTYGAARGNGGVNMQEHRESFAAFLHQARQVFVPDHDVKDRLQRYLPDAKLVVRPHWDESPAKPISQTIHEGQSLRVVTVGGIAPHKGSHILRDCAKDAKERGLPIEYTLIGYSDIDGSMSRYMKVTGEYDLSALPAMLAEGGYHLAFFPVVIPETFNFTLSEVLHHGLFPVCFDIGAIARRVKALGYGRVLPHELSCSPAQVNDALLKLKLPDKVPVEKISAARTRYESFLGDYYGI